jgi:two-component system, OmpR family, sensor kinase
MASTDMEGDARIAQLEAELAALRQEMQDFTYVVSHDLRAPLRHIVSFAQLVQEDAGPQLSSEVKSFLDTITDSAQKLAQMLNALLALSRAGTVPLQPAKVPLQALVNELSSALMAAHPSRTMEWRISADLPEVHADPHLLRQALQQVLDNAVKFTAGSDGATIQVSATHNENGVTLEVRDSGVGFNPGSQSKLFQPFSRLHSAKEFAGLGMGLALAHKCMDRLGGTLSVDAAVGQGCVVRMGLRAAKPDGEN